MQKKKKFCQKGKSEILILLLLWISADESQSALLISA